MNPVRLLSLAWMLACTGESPSLPVPAPPPPPDLDKHCAEAIGEPRVETLAPGLFLAIGYDLASTMLIQTNEGNIIIDTSMSPARATEVRAALDQVAPGPVRAVIYTHSHIDHVGGASVWVEEGTEVWATEAFTEHFFKQYATFLPAESQRGMRQFGRHVPQTAVPCSAIGRRPDLEGARSPGLVLPTHTFSERATLTVGEVTLELREAHGETHDQLFVWWPERRTLFPGDNWYRAFPNLYTIRGTAPRPVDDWIDSLDTMRSLQPELLVPSHTAPVKGAEAIAHELTVYRDGIQWLRDAVVRGANRGHSLDALASSIALPPHLAVEPSLQPLYGRIDWSVRAMYTAELGWFDGKAAHLLPPADAATKMVDLAGGPTQVAQAIEAAMEADDPAWAAHLLGLLDADGRLDAEWRAGMARTVYTALGDAQVNTNARAYLLQAAAERSHGMVPLEEPTLSGDFVERIPLTMLFEVMATRLRPGDSDVHESMAVRFIDLDETVNLTVRRGLLEVHWGEPLPGTPAPVATLVTDANTWRQLALSQRSRAGAFLSGNLSIEGSAPALQRFMDRFDTRIMGADSEGP